MVRWSVKVKVRRSTHENNLQPKPFVCLERNSRHWSSDHKNQKLGRLCHDRCTWSSAWRWPPFPWPWRGRRSRSRSRRRRRRTRRRSGWWRGSATSTTPSSISRPYSKWCPSFRTSSPRYRFQKGRPACYGSSSQDWMWDSKRIATIPLENGPNFETRRQRNTKQCEAITDASICCSEGAQWWTKAKRDRTTWIVKVTQLRKGTDFVFKRSRNSSVPRVPWKFQTWECSSESTEAQRGVGRRFEAEISTWDRSWENYLTAEKHVPGSGCAVAFEPTGSAGSTQPPPGRFEAGVEGVHDGARLRLEAGEGGDGGQARLLHDGNHRPEAVQAAIGQLGPRMGPGTDKNWRRAS